VCVQLPNRRAGSWRSTFAYAPHWERVDDVQLAKAVDDFRLTRQTGVPGRRANRLYVQALRPEGDLVAGEVSGHQRIGANLARVEMQRYERATGHRVIVDDSVNFSVCAARKFACARREIR
jgi:hypothetical protein